jgi:hypothetical protein
MKTEITINPDSKNYASATRAKAEITKLENIEFNQGIGVAPRDIRHIIVPRILENGKVRYHPVAIGADNLDLIHENIMVIG